MRHWADLPPSTLWYLVGLIATDGCLSGDGRHMEITAKDRFFLMDIRRHLKLTNRVRPKLNSKGQISYRIQFGDVGFYRFLLSIGLMPRKSLRLSSIKVDDGHFEDFLGGVIDGDGRIRSWFHPTNGAKQWSLRVYSGSSAFLTWLKNEISRRFRAHGRIHNESPSSHVLKYGKIAAQNILKECYGKGSLSLHRKRDIALLCLRSPSGWARSRTIGQVAELVYAADSDRVSLEATPG